MKIKASTLIEAITAMTIIGIAFGISLISFLAVTGSSNLHRKTRIHQIIRTMACEAKADNNMVNDKWDKEDMTFNKTVEKAGTNGLMRLNIKAYKDSTLLEDYSEYILSDEKN